MYDQPPTTSLGRGGQRLEGKAIWCTFKKAGRQSSRGKGGREETTTGYVLTVTTLSVRDRASVLG